jgi:hypothetical protein
MFRFMIERSRRVRRVAFFWGMLCCMPALALGNSIVVGNHDLQPNQAGQVISLYMTGTDAYKNADIGIFINGGVAGAPLVTHVFGDTLSGIPAANLVGSIWAGGMGGVGINFPDGTTAVGTGLQTISAFQTAGFGSPSTANGIILTLTLDTTGVAPGVYTLSLTDHPSWETLLLFGVDEETFEPIVVPLDILNGTLTVVPEPASVLLALTGLIGLLFVTRRGARHSNVG